MAVLPSRARPAPPWAARRADDDYGVTAQPDWREIDWREHLNSIEIGGRRVNYAEIGSGEGPPVVFVHGLGGSWQNWLENMPRIAQERRVVALDLPGFGESEMPAGEVSISGYGRCVNELCDKLDLGEVVLVGNSMGGFIAAEVAIQFPERVERLALVAAAGISSTSQARRPAQTWGRAAAALGAYGATNVRDVILRPRLRHFALALVARHPTLLKADLCYELVRNAGKPGFMKALNALLAYDFRDRLEDIRCPTLIVWGNEDVMVPVKDASEFERVIPNARKILMEDTGHVPMLERPETFNRCLIDFIAERRIAGERSAEEAVA